MVKHQININLANIQLCSSQVDQGKSDFWIFREGKHIFCGGEEKRRRKSRKLFWEEKIYLLWGRRKKEKGKEENIWGRKILVCRGEEKRRRKRRKIYRIGKCHVGQTDKQKGNCEDRAKSHTQNSQLYFLKVEFDWINYLIEPLQFKPQDCLNDRKGSWT